MQMTTHRSNYFSSYKQS